MHTIHDIVIRIVFVFQDCIVVVVLNMSKMILRQNLNYTIRNVSITIELWMSI